MPVCLLCSDCDCDEAVHALNRTLTLQPCINQQIRTKHDQITALYVSRAKNKLLDLWRAALCMLCCFPLDYIWCPVRSDQPQSDSAEGLHIVCYNPRSHCSGMQLRNRNRLTVADQQAGMPESRQLAGARTSSSSSSRLTWCLRGS